MKLLGNHQKAEYDFHALCRAPFPVGVRDGDEASEGKPGGCLLVLTLSHLPATQEWPPVLFFFLPFCCLQYNSVFWKCKALEGRFSLASPFVSVREGDQEEGLISHPSPYLFITTPSSFFVVVSPWVGLCYFLFVPFPGSDL